jgi:type II restriction enzyme
MRSLCRKHDEKFIDRLIARCRIGTVNLQMTSALAANYKSGCQRARVVTESWGKQNLYCPKCTSDALDLAPTNTQAYDYVCPNCDAPFQLKSRSARIGDVVQDAGFYAMMKAIREDRTPNLFVLHYDKATWGVRNIVLIPHFAFTVSAIIRRKPLSSTARRAGWVGCNIALKNIPETARIPIVSDCSPIPAAHVRGQYSKVLPLAELSVSSRGWTLDVLRVIQTLGKRTFSTNDAYCFEQELSRFYPNNQNVRPKIRQQLQVLRDKGFLKQVERGMWEIIR